MTTANVWWLRLRFLEGQWELVGQSQDPTVVARWDDEIDEKELRTGLDHEWLINVCIPYGCRDIRSELPFGQTRFS